MDGKRDRRRVIWPSGCPDEAVVTHGLLDRWWVQFRMGWAFDPRKLRQVCTSWHDCSMDYLNGGLCGYDDPVAEAEGGDRIFATARHASRPGRYSR